MTVTRTVNDKRLVGPVTDDLSLVNDWSLLLLYMFTSTTPPKKKHVDWIIPKMQYMYAWLFEEPAMV